MRVFRAAGAESTLRVLLDAVQGGASLVMLGPDPLEPMRVQMFSATLESASGARRVAKHGPELLGVLAALAREWESAAARPLDCACYCSDNISAGIPCPPGCCPNVPGRER